MLVARELVAREIVACEVVARELVAREVVAREVGACEIVALVTLSAMRRAGCETLSSEQCNSKLVGGRGTLKTKKRHGTPNAAFETVAGATRNA